MDICSIFHNIFKYMIFQKFQNALLWSKELIRKALSLYFNNDTSLDVIKNLGLGEFVT